VASEVGADARAALADERLASEVRADEREAADLLLQALERAWDDTMAA